MPSILKALFQSNNGGAAYDSGPWATGMVRAGGNSYGSGRKVSTDQALTLSAVFACIRILAENVSTMPLDVYKRSAEGYRDPYPTPDFLVFGAYGSRIDYFSQIMLSLLTDGNAYIATPRDPMGVPVALFVLNPGDVRPRWKKSAPGRCEYDIKGVVYSDLDVLHVKGMLMPGELSGMSPLGYAARTVDLGLQAQEFGASFFSNSAVPAIIVEAPGDAPRDLAERMAGLWEARHGGARNAGKVGVLTGGARATRLTIAPNEAQFLETRQFQVPDVARFFGVPPHLIADASNSTSWGSGLAEQNAAFAQFSLRPWVGRIEEAHNRMFASFGEVDVFVQLNMDAVLRASTKERYEAYQLGLAGGWLLKSEVRTSEDLPAVEGIDDEPEPVAAVVPAPFGEDPNAVPQEQRAVHVHLPETRLSMEPMTFAPVVNVVPPSVTVLAPEVHISNEVRTAAREKIVERDASGQVVRTVDRDVASE